MSANLTLNMEADLNEIERINTAVRILSEAEGWAPELLFQIQLVLEEIGTNIIKYGQDGKGEMEIQITLTSYSASLVMEIEDSGKPFDPFSRSAAAGSRVGCPGSSDRRGSASISCVS